jgi:HIRAN domain
MKVRTGDGDEGYARPSRSGIYPVGLAGEASYQSAIRRCSAGQTVHVVHEIGNPYDKNALAVVTDDGETIGYIARDCWLQDAIHAEGHGCQATIKGISSGGGSASGVVLDVSVGGPAVAIRQFSKPESAPPKQVGPSAAQTKEVKGWLARLFDF